MCVCVCVQEPPVSRGALGTVVPPNLETLADRGHTPLLFASDSLGTVPHIGALPRDLATHGGMQLSTAVATGIGTFIDREATLLSVAASDGDEAHELGVLYYGRRDIHLAMRYFELAHDLGNWEAAYWLASLILHGNFERRDRGELEKARDLLVLAERAGDGRARPNLALVMHWLDPSNASLKERVDRIFGEPARAAEQRQEERDRIQDICASGDAERKQELARIAVLRKAAKRAKRLAAAERANAKAAARAQEQSRLRAERERYDAATPQNADDTFYEDVERSISGWQGADASPRAASPRQSPRFLNLFGDHPGSGGESELDSHTSPDPSQRGPSTPSAEDEQPDPSQGRLSPDSGAPSRRAEERQPPPAQEPKKRGRPKGRKDSKARAVYGSKSNKKTGRGPGRPLGTRDKKKRKRKTKLESAEEAKHAAQVGATRGSGRLRTARVLSDVDSDETTDADSGESSDAS